VKPLHVGVVAACPYPVPQGSQVYIEQTVRALQLGGHDATLVCYGNGLGAPPADIPVLRAARAPFDERTEAGPSLVKPLLDLLLAHALKRHPWDALVAHNYEGLLAALWSGVRPIVYAPHNALADELPHYFGGARWAEKLGRALDDALPRRADAVLALHERLADYLTTCGCARDRIVVHPPAAPLELFNGAPPAERDPFVLYTGNLDRYQNLQLLTEAMRLVRAELPEAQLLVATHSDGDLEGATTLRALGFNAVADLLRQDCIVAAPRVSWSGYPIKLLNALAAGRPIVACDSARGPVVDEHNGLLAPDDDAEAFAAALLRLLRDDALRATLGHNARATAEQHHTLPHLAAALDEALQIGLSFHE
jgi:1,2-diacylglycerol 3-alpha-glucosyltransferase